MSDAGGKKYVTNDIPRPWRVLIHATVTTDLQEENCPGHTKSMEEAVEIALDHFRMNHSKDTYRISLVEVMPNTVTEEQEP